MTSSSTSRRATPTSSTSHPSSFVFVPWMGSCPKGRPDMPLNDCLSIFPIQALNRQELTSGWRMAIATLGEGEDLGFPRLDFNPNAPAPTAMPPLNRPPRAHQPLAY